MFEKKAKSTGTVPTYAEYEKANRPSPFGFSNFGRALLGLPPKQERVRRF